MNDSSVIAGCMIGICMRKPNRRIGAEAYAVLEALGSRLRESAEVEIELITIMEFCEGVLRSQGVNLKVVAATENKQ